MTFLSYKGMPLDLSPFLYGRLPSESPFPSQPCGMLGIFGLPSQSAAGNPQQNFLVFPYRVFMVYFSFTPSDCDMRQKIYTFPARRNPKNLMFSGKGHCGNRWHRVCIRLKHEGQRQRAKPKTMNALCER